MADNCALKFSGDIKRHWEEAGHEVRYEIGASEFIAQWADVYYVEWWDNNIHYLYNWYLEHHEAKKPKFIVRAIDWDIWTRGIRSQRMVDFVDYIVCIAPHMEQYLRNEKDNETGELIRWGEKLRLIRPGVNLEEFRFQEKQNDGFQIGMVLGDMWLMKNPFEGLGIFTALYNLDKRYHLHLRGQHEPGDYYPHLFNHFVSSRGITGAYTLYGYQNTMSQWYQNIDILLHPSLKETYCYAVAEASAMGTPVVCNNFPGAGAIWPKEWLYNNPVEAVEKIRNESKWNMFNIRAYMEEHHDIKRMLTELDKLL